MAKCEQKNNQQRFQWLQVKIKIMNTNYQTKSGCKGTSSLEARVEIAIFYYKSLHCDLDTEDSEPLFLHWHSGSWCCITIPSLVSKWSTLTITHIHQALQPPHPWSQKSQQHPPIYSYISSLSPTKLTAATPSTWQNMRMLRWVQGGDEAEERKKYLPFKFHFSDTFLKNELIKNGCMKLSCSQKKKKKKVTFDTGMTWKSQTEKCTTQAKLHMALMKKLSGTWWVLITA